MVVDFNYFLRQKYAQLQQQADATTTNAAANTRNAATNALTGDAAARLDRTRAALLPAESQASIAKMGAETNLIGEQASIVRPESAARIANMNADTNFTRTQDKVAQRQGLESISTILGAQLPGIQSLLQPTRSLGGGSIYRTSDIAPATTRRAAAGGNPGRMTAEELDRYNGL